MALSARRGYLMAFRQSIERRDLAPAEVRLSGGDLSTVETLVAGARASRAGPRRLRDRRARVAGQAQPGHAAAALSRVAGGPGPRALRARRGRAATSPSSGCRRSAGLLVDPGRRASAPPRSARWRRSARRTRRRWRGRCWPIRTRGSATTAAIALAGQHEAGRRRSRRERRCRAQPADTRATPTARRGATSPIAVRHIADPRFRPAADPAALRSRAGSGGRGDGERPRGRHRRLRLRAGAGHAAPQPPCSRGGPAPCSSATANRSSTRSRTSCATPTRTSGSAGTSRRRSRQIPSQKSVDVLVAGARGAGRVPALQDRSPALERLRRDHGDAHVPARADRGAHRLRGNRYFNYLSLHYNLFGKQTARRPTRCWPTRSAEDGPDEGPDLPAAGADLSVEGHRRRRVDAAARRPAQPGERVRVSRQRPERAACASASCRVLEDLPVDEKVRRGNVLLKTRPRDVEETLLQLINDDDQVVAAAAIDVGAPAADVEPCRRHRARARASRRARLVRVRGGVVGAGGAADAGRAAARAVARAAAGRGARRPAAHACRSSRRSRVDELFRIAGASRQVRHEPGSILLKEGDGARPACTCCWTAASVATRPDSAPRSIEPPAALGFDEALQGQPMRETVRTEEVAVTLVLTVDELRTLLADNTDLVSGLFATLRRPKMPRAAAASSRRPPATSSARSPRAG